MADNNNTNNNTLELGDEQLEQVSGGTQYPSYNLNSCPSCGCTSINSSYSGGRYNCHCTGCGLDYTVGVSR